MRHGFIQCPDKETISCEPSWNIGGDDWRLCTRCANVLSRTVLPVCDVNDAIRRSHVRQRPTMLRLLHLLLLLVIFSTGGADQTPWIGLEVHIVHGQAMDWWKKEDER